MKQVDFFEKLIQYRLTASILYDKGKKSGLNPEDLAESINPLIKNLEELIRKSIHDDLAGVIVAIQMLQNEIEQHHKASQIFLQKAKDTQNHIDRLKKGIKVHLLEKGLDQVRDGDYWANLVDGEVVVR